MVETPKKKMQRETQVEYFIRKSSIYSKFPLISLVNLICIYF